MDSKSNEQDYSVVVTEPMCQGGLELAHATFRFSSLERSTKGLQLSALQPRSVRLNTNRGVAKVHLVSLMEHADIVQACTITGLEVTLKNRGCMIS